MNCFDSNSYEYLLIQTMIGLCLMISETNYNNTIDEQTYNHSPYGKKYKYKTLYKNFISFKHRNVEVKNTSNHSNLKSIKIQTEDIKNTFKEKDIDEKDDPNLAIEIKMIIL